MNTDTASVQIPHSRTTTSLSDLTEQIPQWAEEHGLVPIPALPGDFVGLEREGVPLSDLGARECVALAARLGARGRYFEAETFHPDLFVPLDEEQEEEEELSDQLRTSLKELRHLLLLRHHPVRLGSGGILNAGVGGQAQRVQRGSGGGEAGAARSGRRSVKRP